MRRSIVLISFLAGVAAALSILAPATPANAIICPQESPRVPPPCCPIPTRPAGQSAHLQPICCPPTTCCATGMTTAQPCCLACCPTAGCCASPCVAGSLTIAASPSPSKAGRKVVISGGFTRNPQSGAQVVLWRELTGQSSFQQMSHTTTNSSGKYTFTLGGGAVMADQAWYVTSDGLRSPTIQQQVSALVGLSLSARSIGVGDAIRLSGHVTPSHAGEVVLIEASRGGAWQVIARPQLGRGSSYAVSGRFSRPGAVRLRVVLPGDNRNPRSTSPTVTIAVE
jgi:hypothetical protein